MSYNHAPDPAVLYQGDILRDFLFLQLPEKPHILQSSAIHQEGDQPQLFVVRDREEVPQAFANGRPEALVISATLTNVAIVSQSCDIQRKPFVTVAAVRPMSSIEGEKKKDDIRNLHRRFEYFALPSDTDFEESYVDLTLLFSIENSVLKSYIGSRVRSMDTGLRQNFQFALILYFGRPAKEEKDNPPQQTSGTT